LFVLFDKISKFVANVGTLFVSSCHEELANTFVCQGKKKEKEKKSIEVKLHEVKLWHTHIYVEWSKLESSAK
jgi:hypothetical protein